MHKSSVFSYSIADTLFTTCNFYRCHTVPFTHMPQHICHAISHVSHPGWSENGEALIKSFQKETRSTREQGDNPCYIYPRGINPRWTLWFCDGSRDGPTRMYSPRDLMVKKSRRKVPLCHPINQFRRRIRLLSCQRKRGRFLHTHSHHRPWKPYASSSICPAVSSVFHVYTCKVQKVINILRTVLTRRIKIRVQLRVYTWRKPNQEERLDTFR